MSTQTSFDVTGLSRAIQRRDWQYHLALYAAHAEIEIVDPAQPDTPLQVLRGKAAIGAWLQGMSSAAVNYEVRDAHADPAKVTYSEECRYADGSSVVFECSADVRRGQIVHSAVTLAHVPCHQDAPQHRQRTNPGSPKARTRPGLQRQGGSLLAASRNLPGNFLG